MRVRYFPVEICYWQLVAHRPSISVFRLPVIFRPFSRVVLRPTKSLKSGNALRCLECRNSQSFCDNRRDPHRFLWTKITFRPGKGQSKRHKPLSSFRQNPIVYAYNSSRISMRNYLLPNKRKSTDFQKKGSSIPLSLTTEKSAQAYLRTDVFD